MKKTKKGFTIVELVIVIAIIAILAAILIPTFSKIIKKANSSSDTQLIRNLNAAVAVDLTEKGLEKHSTMYDAIEACEEAGYLPDVIVAKSEYNIAWESFSGHFVLLDMENGKVKFPTEQYNAEEYLVTDHGKAEDYFVVTKSSQYDVNAGGFKAPYDKYSVYAYDDNNWPTEVATTKGFDAGSVTTFTKISYANINDAQSIIIRTNGGALVVNGKVGASAETSDEVFHYGKAQKVEVSVAEFCFYTHAVIGYMDAKQGKIVADKGAYVYLFKAHEGCTAIEQNGGVFIVPQGVCEGEIPSSIVEQLGYKVEDGIIVVDSNSSVGKDKVGKTAYVISTKEELFALRDVFYAGKFDSTFKIVLNGDIDISGEDWTPIGNWEYPFHGTLDGQGYTITGLTASTSFTEEGVFSKGKTTGFGEVFGFFGIVGGGDVTIQNVNFDKVNISNKNAQNVGTVIGYSPKSSNFSEEGKGGTYIPGKWDGNTTIGKCNILLDNVSVSGTLDVKAHVGGFIGKVYSETNVTILNCTNNTKITSYDTGGLAGFVGYSNTKVKCVNCVNTKDSSIDFVGSGSVSPLVSDFVLSSSSELAIDELINCTSDMKLPNFEGKCFKNLRIYFSKEATLKNCTIEKLTCHSPLTIENVTVSELFTNNDSVTAKNLNSVSVINRGEMVIDGGKFGIMTCSANSETIIENGTFSGKITVKEGAKLTIDNINTTEKIVNYGTLVINNGEYCDLSNYNDATINNGTFTGKITIGEESTNTTINNGNFKGTYSNPEKVKVNFNGGKYSFDIMSYIDYSKNNLVYENSQFNIIKKDAAIDKTKYEAFYTNKIDDASYEIYFDKAQDAIKYGNITLFKDATIKDVTATSSRTITLGGHKLEIDNIILKTSKGVSKKLTITGSKGEVVALKNINVGTLSFKSATVTISNSSVSSITMSQSTKDYNGILNIVDDSLNSVKVSMNKYTKVDYDKVNQKTCENTTGSFVINYSN